MTLWPQVPTNRAISPPPTTIGLRALAAFVWLAAAGQALPAKWQRLSTKGGATILLGQKEGTCGETLTRREARSLRIWPRRMQWCQQLRPGVQSADRVPTGLLPNRPGVCSSSRAGQLDTGGTGIGVARPDGVEAPPHGRLITRWLSQFAIARFPRAIRFTAGRGTGWPAVPVKHIGIRFNASRCGLRSNKPRVWGGHRALPAKGRLDGRAVTAAQGVCG